MEHFPSVLSRADSDTLADRVTPAAITTRW
jgi:hypothetical protein